MAICCVSEKDKKHPAPEIGFRFDVHGFMNFEARSYYISLKHIT